MSNLKSRRVDLDDIERQLQNVGPGASSARHDPLAELARIVGQDDPFRTGQMADGGPGEHRDSVEDLHPASASASSLGYDLRRAAATDARSFQANGYAGANQTRDFDGDYADGRHSHADHGSGYAEPPFAQPRRSKKGLVTVGAVLGLAALGVGGALAFRDSTSLGGGTTPLVVQADKGPLKIQPQNPGGMDIPDQNKQIYERGAPEKQTRIVNREEQPVDVQQAARAIAAVPAAPAPSLSGSGSSGIIPLSTATPGSTGGPAQTGSLAASLGEPKRVKTVAIRPDGSVLSDAGPAKAKPAASSSATPPARPSPTQTGSTQRDTPAAAPAPEAPKTPTRVAALTTPSATPAPAAAAAGGGFAVQLGHRPSEEEARTAFKELQKKYPGELGGKAALIRKAEVNEKTVYRVRVGFSAKGDADALCGRLKTAGQPCFVAAN